MTKEQDRLHSEMLSACSAPGGGEYICYILHATHDLIDRIKAEGGIPGDLIIAALLDWGRSTEAGLKRKEIPICACCETIIRKGTVGGFIIMVPATDAKGAIGSTAAFCNECSDLDRDTLTERLVQSIRDDYNAEVKVSAIQ